MAGSEGLLSVDYEVSGRVQGVFFRKYTQVRGGVGGGGAPPPWATHPAPPNAINDTSLIAASSHSSPLSVFSPQGEAQRLGLVGWVRNSSHGTVQGQVQGPAERVRELQEWLRKTGSPQSRISHAEFRNERPIAALEHADFKILK